MKRRRSRPIIETRPGAFADFRFPPEVIQLAVRWCLRFGLSYRVLEELWLNGHRGRTRERVPVGPVVHHPSWSMRHGRVATRSVPAGSWTRRTWEPPTGGVNVYQAVDEKGQVIDELLSAKRGATDGRRFSANAMDAHGEPTEVTTDKAWALARAIADAVPGAWHLTDQHANNRIESDHARLKARLRPMRGPKSDRSARIVIRGHAFLQNLRRGHY